ncbi:hypothetical protein GSI_14384 [Ganoderma sinense ZZ0214-1]|uniref:DUF6534 domain-containing protein n=1 Tax=Ganoderma sinense ZZ0214-1 TaxID=1077348 RepID=A0A2G8RNI9_9APHY|nr:hypothetical protein GSI_14384 [Ganoderma sinense ZZ0214-1]
MDSECSGIKFHFQHRGATIGVGYLGVVFTSVVYGITCIQSFQYYRSPRAKTDVPLIKFLVGGVWMLDTLQEVFAMHTFYFYLIENFDNPKGLLVPIWSIPAGILVNACVSFSVKMFFLMRIWKLSRNSYVTIIGAMVNAARLVMNLYYPIRSFFALNVNLMILEVRLKPYGSSSLALEVACDLLISICMAYYLQRERRNALQRVDLPHRSGDMLSRLIILTVATGTLSTLIAMADLVAYLTSPDTFYVLFFNFLIAKLDANALLTSLNSREYVRDGSDPMSLSSIELSRKSVEPNRSACCLHNGTDPKMVSWTLGSKEGSRTDVDRDRPPSLSTNGEIVCKVVVEEAYAV